jgi:hypothetical protein
MDYGKIKTPGGKVRFDQKQILICDNKFPSGRKSECGEVRTLGPLLLIM